MRIKTVHFGEIEIEPGDILTLRGGLIPFAALEQFVLLSHEEEEPFQWLQCVQVPELAVVTVPVAVAFPDFQPHLPVEVRGWLKLGEKEEPLWLATVVLARRLEEMSANLLAPIAINLNARRGKQVVQELDTSWARRPLVESVLVEQ
ncbi:MAG: flagellar assembly protein FliW [Armatimonadetes bacterium]|nr:flagellar assembly protein FliW [Armatimonadota bacterium]